jgi:hypothetical protein
MEDDVADWLKSEAKKQGKTQADLVKQALNSMRYGDRQGDDKLSEIWNDNGRIIAMLNEILTGDIKQQLAFIYGKVAAKNSPKFDPLMMPKSISEIGLFRGTEEPNLLTHSGDFDRAKAVFSYWSEWRNYGNEMPQIPHI